MSGLIPKLPSTFVLGTLAAVFLITCRKHSSARVRLWVLAWVLVLFHVSVRLAEEVFSLPHNWSTAFGISAFLFTGISFAISSSPIAEFPECRNRLFVLLGTPAVLISFVVAFGPRASWLSAFASAIMYFGTIAFFASRRWKSSPLVLTLYIALGLSGILAAFRSAQGQSLFAVQLTLAWLFLLSALMFARSCRRWSTGVVVAFVGFLSWSAIWALAAFLPTLEASIGDFSEFWNVPNYILAFGMILVLLEDEQITSELVRERERGLTHQLKSFAEVTSRLLSVQDVRALCGEIAVIITRVTTFQSVAITLADEQQTMRVVGSAGMSPDVLASLEESVGNLTPQRIADLEAQGRRVGRSSFVCSQHQVTGRTAATHALGANPFWLPGDELIVPIRSPRGTYAGFISLDAPRDLTRINALEMSQLELLAEDLGVALDRAYLQRELVRSEKLASIGQLVAGMAHELNNPLTAVLGYSEMITELSTDEQVRHQAGIIQRESLRMKRIIENLVRFSKQDKSERKLISINSYLDELLKLWSYQAKGREIELEAEVEPDLPMIRFDEPHLKQVLLNILTNAFDAVETTDLKRITVRATLNHGIVSVTVLDSGLGFSEPERVFDPFFTTKGVGKGTGLGLSVCYGIVKQHGGDIRAFNLKPNGAGITIEFPAAQQELALTATGD